MASHPIPSRHLEGGKVEMVTAFLFLGSKIFVDGDCSHEIRRLLLLGRKAMTNLDSVLKIRYITLLTKIHIVKSMVFPEGMYGLRVGSVKKAEHQRIDAFKVWCWRRLLRVSWTARKSNQSILSRINHESSLGRNDAELKLHYFGHRLTHWKSPWWWERLRADREEGIRRLDDRMASPMQWTWT